MESKLKQLAKQRAGMEFEMFSKESVRWFQSQIRGLRNPIQMSRDIIRENDRRQTRFLLGNLYYFMYDPKHAKVLPYYDIFPLVLVLRRYNDGILGLNLHYLPIQMRAAFLDMLMPYAKFDDEGLERIKITYNILTSTRKYKAFEPCLKHYLYECMGSKPMKVFPDEWESAVFLPVERFQKAKKEKVFKESINEIREK